MKKRIYKFLFVIAIFASLLITTKVKAYEYSIEDYFVNATIEKNGDLTVEEYFDYNGEYNGILKGLKSANKELPDYDSTLPYFGGTKLHNGDDIIINNIIAVDKNSNFDFTDISGNDFTLVSSAKQGDYGVYEKTYNSTNKEYNLKIYIPSTENKAIYLKYTITNIAIKHNDIGELYWTILNNDNTESIKNTKIVLNIPNAGESYYVWAHGPYYGKVEKNKNMASLEITGLPANKMFDVRVTFPLGVINLSTKYSNDEVLDKILKFEESLDNQQNYNNYMLINNTISSCKLNPTRECYNAIKNYYNAITDDEIKNDLTDQIKEVKNLLTEKEETEAKNDTATSEEYLDYYDYTKACKSVSILENKTLKQSLENRLDIVKEKIIEKENKLNIIFTVASISSIIFIIVLVIIIYIAYDKEYESSFKQKYNREIPSKIHPTSLTYLMEHEITQNGISASILRLINNKVIKCEKIEKEKDNYELTLLQEDINSLGLVDQSIIKFLFQDRTKVNLKEIKKDAKKDYQKYINEHNAIISNAKKDARNYTFYESDYKSSILSSSKLFFTIFIFIFFSIVNPIFGLILAILYFTKLRKAKDEKKNKGRVIIGVILFSLCLLNIFAVISEIALLHFIKFSIKYTIIAIVLIIPASIYLFAANKRTRYGNEEYAKWTAFKNFLKDFSKMDSREIKEIVLWEDYLVYATALNCAKELQKNMKIELGSDDNLETLVTINELNHMQYIISRTIASSYQSAVSAKSIQTSSSSGGGGGSFGGGGGFSSSSGGGGGGGSFGRF